jgi:hypothetical protein
MRYFHRTALQPDGVLAEADRVLGARLATVTTAPRRREYQGPVGHMAVSVRAEGGHYTLVTVETDQVGESEADKMAKRFLAVVHAAHEPAHTLRGAY